MRRIRSALMGIVAAAWIPHALGQEVILRHGLEGKPLDALATLVVRFNGEQKGKAKVTLQDVGALESTAPLPHMALLDPADSWQFFGTQPRFRPMHQVLAESGVKLQPRQFLPQIAGAVDDLTGKIQALPIALALPVLFYNQEAFRKAGLDPDSPPRTWWEVQKAAGALFDAGYKCPLTTSRFAWVHVENLSSQHGEAAIAREGKTDRATLNTLVHVKHIALLASWHKSNYFHYFGPGREGDRKFADGECAMLTGESPLYVDLKARAAFPFGTAELPYYDDVRGARPADVLPDGAALWMLPGKKKDEYRVIARFVEFLLRPETQREWVHTTGFLPMTPAALEALAASGVSPVVIESARKRLSVPLTATARTKQGNGRSRIRTILNEEIEFVWGNKKPAKEALDAAASRANPVLAAPGR